MWWIKRGLFGMFVALLQVASGAPAAFALPDGALDFHDVACGKPIELSTFIGEDGGYGFKDTEGNVVLAPDYAIAWSFNSSGYGYADGAYIDPTGRPVFTIFAVDNGPDYIREGLHRFQRDKKVGFLTECMDVAIEPKFDFAGFFQDGLAPACEGCERVPLHEGDWEHTKWAGGSWGIIDRTGAYVVPPTLTDTEIWAALEKVRRKRQGAVRP